MSTSQPHAKSTTTPSKGLFAVLSGLLTSKGTTTPSTTPSTQGPVRPHTKLLALVAISLVALFATTASAGAAPLKTEMGAISEVSYTTAHVTGKVTGVPCAGFCAPLTYSFQYATSESGPWSPGPGGSFNGTTSPNLDNEPVKGDLEGLKGGTKYFVRLVANNPSEPEAIDPAAPPYPSFITLTVEQPTIVAADDASDVFSLQAKATGKVKRPANPDAAFNVTACRFEYVTDEQFTNNPSGEEFAGAGQAPCAEVSPENPITDPNIENGEREVTAQLSGLSPATTYHLRLAAENAAPAAATKEATNTFTTTAKVAPPTVLAADNATELAKRSAKATGKVERPAGNDPALDVSCRFEFIADAQFTANPPGEEFLGAGQAPCAENPITSSAPDYLAVAADVSAELPGLEPGTTYHLRLVAENGAGSDVEDAVTTFTTIAVIPPTVAVDSIDDIGYTSVSATGTFDPGNQGVFTGFEFAPAGTEDWVGTQVDINRIAADEPAQQISLPFPCYGNGRCTPPLKPGTTYQVRAFGYESEFQELGRLFYSDEPNLEFTTLGTSAPPIASLDPITDFTATTAHFSGTVDANAPAGPLSEEGKSVYRTKWHIECSPECKDVNGNEIGGTVEAEEGSKGISVDVKRLDPHTHYEVRLIAENGLGNGEDEEPLDTPLIKPTLKAFPGGSDGKGGYVLQGTVNPNGSPLSECFFAWGPDSGDEPKDYAFKAPCSPLPKPVDEVQVVRITPGLGGGTITFGFNGQTSAPIPYNPSAAEVQSALEALSAIGAGNVEVTGGFTVTFKGALAATNTPTLVVRSSNGGFGGTVTTSVPGGNSLPVTVEAPLTSLEPGAIYNFRLFATNEAGEEKSENLKFSPTLAKSDPCANQQLRTENNSLALPECRAYEMVTPPGKEGQEGSLVTYDGGARVAYRSRATNIAKSGQGNPVKNFYVAERTSSGWETIPDLNGSSGSLRDAPSYVDTFYHAVELWAYSPDLLSSVWSVHQKGDPDIGSSGPSLLGFPHLRTPDGTFAPIGPMTRDITPPGAPVVASDDLSHVVNAISAGVGPGVYEYVGTGNPQPRRVDLDNSGAPISTCAQLGYAEFRSLSRDGTRIFFRVFGGCDPGNPPAGEIWARINGTTAIDVSASHCNRTAADPGGLCNGPTEPGGCAETQSGTTSSGILSPGCRNANFGAATPDGSRVFFTTTQQLVNADTDQTNDIYACDLPSGNPAPSAEKANHCAAFRQVSGARTGADVEGFIHNDLNSAPESFLPVSEDGSTVLFTAKGVLADNEDALGEKAVAGDHNLYVWRADASHPDGLTTFIGRLDSNDLSAGFGQVPQYTPDGRYVLFTTASQIVDTDTDSARDVYRYDADTDTLTRVSTNVFGVGGNGAFDARMAAPTEHNPSATVSDDGTKIVFTTTEALAPADGNAEPDVYLWTPSRVSLISTGSSGFAPRAPSFPFGIGSPNVAITSSGDDIYFESAQQLTPADGDSSNDVYDARIGGGFSFAPPPICAGEACQPPASNPPEVPTPAANRPKPNGNVVPKKPCPKGKVRNKKGKCVKKHKKHHNKSHKKAGHNRGGSK